MAQASVQVSPKNQKGQPAARRFQMFWDQHGRKYGANIEIKTGDPTAGIERIGWSAPLLCEQKYLEVTKDSDGTTIPGRLTVNYEAWIRDVAQQRQDHLERLGFFAQALYGEKAGAAIKQPTPELRRLLKSDPAPVEPIYAAMKGDPWILGLEDDDPPEYLAPYFRNKQAVPGTIEVEIDSDFQAELEARLETARVKGDLGLSPMVRESLEQLGLERQQRERLAGLAGGEG
jgi:hypothetical protein